MTDPEFWRIVWKEYRAQRVLWLCVAGLGGGAFLVARSLPGTTLTPATLIATAAITTGLFALASAASLFALEREEETLDFLRQLPSPQGRVFAAKLAFVVVAVVALWGMLLWFGAAVGSLSWASVFFDDSANHILSRQWQRWGIAVVEARPDGDGAPPTP